MGNVYHGSKIRGIKRLEPRESTHGVYVYATTEKVLALVFSGRCGDNLDADIILPNSMGVDTIFYNRKGIVQNKYREVRNIEDLKDIL